MGDLLQAPPATHLVYVPFVLFIGVVIGFVIGRKAGKRDGQAEMLGGGDDEFL